MRRLMLCVAFSISMVGCATTPAAPAAGPAAGATEVNPYGKFFEGDGVTVEMATFAKADDGASDVVLRISGAEAFNDGINGKAIKYSSRVAGAGGTGLDVFGDVKGSEYVRMTLRNSSWEVYMSGKSYRLSVDEAKSKQLDTKKLVADLGK